MPTTTCSPQSLKRLCPAASIGSKEKRRPLAGNNKPAPCAACAAARTRASSNTCCHSSFTFRLSCSGCLGAPRHRLLTAASIFFHTSSAAAGVHSLAKHMAAPTWLRPKRKLCAGPCRAWSQCPPPAFGSTVSRHNGRDPPRLPTLEHQPSLAHHPLTTSAGQPNPLVAPPMLYRLARFTCSALCIYRFDPSSSLRSPTRPPRRCWPVCC